MKLANCDTVTQRFPDGSTASRVSLTFEKDGTKIIKRVGITSTAAAVSRKSDLRNEAAYLVLRAYREAERDAAFVRYGDKWRDHVTFGRFFKTEMSEDERRVVDEALQKLVEQA